MSDEKSREVKYLCTRELNVEFDVKSFLSASTTKLNIESLKLVDADAVFRTTMTVLSDFNLDVNNLMTDNCPVMRGSENGFVKKMSDHCPCVINIDGCGCHKMNLLQKDAAKENTVRQIIAFAERLSNFLDNKPKVQSILHQCQNFIGLNRISDYCGTRFLSLFRVIS